ncbi:amidohydrolase [Phyllosticta citricarpa]
MDGKHRGRRPPPPLLRKSRCLKLVAVACLAFLAYAQWCQLDGNLQVKRNHQALLSASRLRSDFVKCPNLRRKPSDPSGPTLIKNATAWTGEPIPGTTAQEAHEGLGYVWTQAEVFLESGLIKKVGAAISESELPSDYQVYGANGFQLTSGIIDMHSHAGVDPLPRLVGNEDTNELSADITPFVINSGGVTTSLVLPGSGNNIGGEAFVVKHAVGKPDGRFEISVTDMLADPERTWRYMKIACRENAKKVYGKVGERGPRAFEKASALVKAQDEWCDAASFRGPALAFHHAHETYIDPEILKRARGGRPPAATLFADNMLYKAEAYRGCEQAGKILYENGITPVYVRLPYHAALAGVTSAPAEFIGLGKGIEKVEPGFDADIVLWDSDPMSVGAAPVQVWIDGTAQFKNPYILKKPKTVPIHTNLPSPSAKDQSLETGSVVFTGISRILLPDFGDALEVDGGSPHNLFVVNSTITRVGKCQSELFSFNAAEMIDLKNKHLSPPFALLGSNGKGVFSRALAAAYRHGVTKAATAPIFSGGGSYGVSAGFLTHASHSLEDGAVWADEVAVHYNLGLGAKDDTTPSISSAVGALRDYLLGVIDYETLTTKYSAQSYFHRVVTAQMPLVITVDSADTTASILRMKAVVEQAANSKIRLAIIGGAESHLVAKELAAADSWDQRRSLTGAPLTNGTAIDALVDADVTAIGTVEDWEARDLGLMAGIAYANGEGKLSEQDALDLISTNVYKILGLDKASEKVQNPRNDFVVYEGSPLEIRSRLVAVGSGQGVLSVFM